MTEEKNTSIHINTQYADSIVKVDSCTDQQLSDMAHYMSDEQLYMIEGMAPMEALRTLQDKCGDEELYRLLQLCDTPNV